MAAMANNLDNLVNARGIVPVYLSQLVNPGLGPKCGWCGWAPPQDDVLGALAYCTREGLACPDCRSSQWNGGAGDEPFSANDVFFDAVSRGAGAVLAARYMLSWVRHHGITLPAKQEVLQLMRQARLDEEQRAEEKGRWLRTVLGPQKEYFVHALDVNEMFYFRPNKPFQFWAGLMKQVQLPARNPRVDEIPVYIVALSTSFGSDKRNWGPETFHLEWKANGSWWNYKVFAYHLHERWGGGTFRKRGEEARPQPEQEYFMVVDTAQSRRIYGPAKRLDIQRRMSKARKAAHRQAIRVFGPVAEDELPNWEDDERIEYLSLN